MRLKGCLNRILQSRFDNQIRNGAAGFIPFENQVGISPAAFKFIADSCASKPGMFNRAILAVDHNAISDHIRFVENDGQCAKKISDGVLCR